MLTTITRTVVVKAARRWRSSTNKPRRVPRKAIAIGITTVVTVLAVVVSIVLVTSLLMSILTRAAGPLQVVSNTITATDATSAAKEQQELNEVHDELARATDPHARCLLDSPEVVTQNQALYIGKVDKDAKNAELVSDRPPLVEPGTQVMVNGRATEQARRVASTVPEGTHAAVARAYLVTALAGGTTDFDHFTRVASRALDGQPVTPDNAVRVAQAFFPPGVDLAPYYKVADSIVFGLASKGYLTGKIEFTADTLTACENLSEARSK